MLYYYVAVDKTGKVTEGEVDADSTNGVLRYLAGRELGPISVTPVKEVRLGRRRLFGGIKIADKIFLTKYLSLMLQVGTDLLSAINILIVDFDNPAMKNLLLEVRDNLVKGRPFYEAFSRYPRYFSPVFVNLVKSAEASGNLQKTFEELSVSLGEEAELRSRIRSALIYPIILLVASSVVLLFISTFALPRIANIFSQSEIKPPLFSRVVFGIGLFIDAHIISILIITALVVGFSIYFFKFNLLGRRLFDRFLDFVPIIKKVRRQLAVQRFASTLSSLMKAGLPIMEAINITAATVGLEEMKLSLKRVSQEGLAKGLTIGEAFRREPVFPRVVTNLVAISEKAGHLEEVLKTLANFYATNIDSVIKSLVSFLEPVLLMIMGLVVAVIALSIIVPIYQLTAQF